VLTWPFEEHRMPSAKLTRDFVTRATAEPGKARTIYWDEGLPGFGLMVTEGGHRSYTVQYRSGSGRSGIDRRMTIKDVLKLNDARREAKAILGRVAKGQDPLQEKRDKAAKATGTLKAVCEAYLAREGGMKRDDDGKVTFTDKSKLRSAPYRRRFFERRVYKDKIAGRPIQEIKRSEVVKLLDRIEEDEHGGPQAAHQALAFLSRLFSWYASRNDDFRSPIVRGMGRVKPRERARKRVLNDEEIRDVWTALDNDLKIPVGFKKLVRVLLLTAVRRTEAARMAWHEVERLRRDDFEGDVWTCPAARMKGKLDHAVPLTPAVWSIIGERMNGTKSRPFVFSTSGGEKPFSGYSKAKRALDRAIADLRKAEGRGPMPPWQLHDLRRTAKTLMQRAGVRPDISERVLAHVIPGVEGVYDRYEYLAEKRDALERLASLIERILHPAENVASLDERRAATS
jgi:integrase